MIDAARTLTDRTMLMVLSSTGMRNAELRWNRALEAIGPPPRSATRAAEGAEAEGEPN